MKKNNLIVQLCIIVGAFSLTLFGMQPWEHPVINNLILQNTAPQTAAIRKSFIDKSGMAEEEEISFISFKEMTKDAKRAKKQFILAAAQLENKDFRFFDATSLANHFLLRKTDLTPGRAAIKELFIYTYNAESNDTEFPFDYQKIITPEHFKEEFTNKYTSIDPTESVRRNIVHLQSLPQNEDILHETTIERIELIRLLNPTKAKDQGPHSQEIFTILGQISQDAQLQAERSYAEHNMIEMLMNGWGQPNNQPNYHEAIRLCNDLISSNLQFRPEPGDRRSMIFKLWAIDYGRFNLAEMARLGLGQPNNQPNIKEAIRLYKLITSKKEFDGIYFKSKLALANIYDKDNKTLLNARKLYTEIIKEAQEQAQHNNLVDQATIAEAQENLKKNILKTEVSRPASPIDID
jgi:hypothetical protein